MEGETSVLLDVTVALVIALAAGWIATRLQLSSIVGYVIAGLVISPFTPGFGADVDRQRLDADIGVVLLLFTIGAQFSVADLRGVGGRTIAAAIAQVAIVFGAMLGVGLAAGWSRDASMYIAVATTSTSSVVVVRLLDTRGETSARHGRLAVGFSVVQDLSAVILVVLVGGIAGGGGGAGLIGESVRAMAKSLAFVAGVIIVGVTVAPRFLRFVAAQRSRELFFVAMAALAIGTALGAEQAGVSLALGAFLAGIIVSESDLSHRVIGELLPTRDVFAVLFFVSAGMLVEPSVVRDSWERILAVAAIIVVFKPLVIGGLFAIGRQPPPVTVLGAAFLVPAAEFSFVFAGDGLNRGALTREDFGIVVAATVISIILSPLAVALGRRIVSTMRQNGQASPGPRREPSRVGHHAVIAGYDHVGETVAAVLAPRFRVVVVTEDGREAQRAREQSAEVIEGTPTSETVIDMLELEDARVLVIALSDPFGARLLTELARARNPYLEIVVRATSPGDADALSRSGASEAVVDEDEIALELIRASLQRFSISALEVTAIVQRQRGRLREARA
jgi:CPA2 family monovalent cation:H+ antiporter-2